MHISFLSVTSLSMAISGSIHVFHPGLAISFIFMAEEYSTTVYAMPSLSISPSEDIRSWFHVQAPVNSAALNIVDAPFRILVFSRDLSVDANIKSCILHFFWMSSRTRHMCKLNLRQWFVPGETGLRCFGRRIRHPPNANMLSVRRSHMRSFCLGAVINKDPPARKEQLPGGRKYLYEDICQLSSSSVSYQLQSAPHWGHAFSLWSGHMSLTGLDGCKADTFSPALDLWRAMLALELPASMKTLLGLHCSAFSLTQVLLPLSFIPQMLIPKKDHAPQNFVSTPASAEAKWWGLSE